MPGKRASCCGSAALQGGFSAFSCSSHLELVMPISHPTTTTMRASIVDASIAEVQMQMYFVPHASTAA